MRKSIKESVSEKATLLEAKRAEFGEWVRRTREQIINPKTKEPITQREAAAKAGISRGQWNRIEQGEGTKPITIMAIARVLGYTTEEEMNEVLRRAGFMAGEDMQIEIPRAVRRLFELPEEIQRDVMSIIDRFHDMHVKRKEPGRK